MTMCCRSTQEFQKGGGGVGTQEAVISLNSELQDRLNVPCRDSVNEGERERRVLRRWKELFVLGHKRTKEGVDQSVHEHSFCVPRKLGKEGERGKSPSGKTPQDDPDAYPAMFRCSFGQVAGNERKREREKKKGEKKKKKTPREKKGKRGNY